MTADVIDFPKLTRPPAVTFEQLASRLGRFVIAHESIHAQPEIVLAIMARVIVLQATCCNVRQHTLYLALSAEFARIEDLAAAPFYEWRYDRGAMRAYRFGDPDHA